MARFTEPYQEILQDQTLRRVLGSHIAGKFISCLVCMTYESGTQALTWLNSDAGNSERQLAKCNERYNLQRDKERMRLRMGRISRGGFSKSTQGEAQPGNHFQFQLVNCRFQYQKRCIRKRTRKLVSCKGKIPQNGSSKRV